MSSKTAPSRPRVSISASRPDRRLNLNIRTPRNDRGVVQAPAFSRVSGASFYSKKCDAKKTFSYFFRRSRTWLRRAGVSSLRSAVFQADYYILKSWSFHEKAGCCIQLRYNFGLQVQRRTKQNHEGPHDRCRLQKIIKITHEDERYPEPTHEERNGRQRMAS